MSNGQAPDMSALIGTLLSNPEALSGIMGILKNSGITLNKPEAADFVQKAEPKKDPETEAIATATHLYSEENENYRYKDREREKQSRESGRKKPCREDRERLLAALRPYLSSTRYDTLDEIIKFASILELFRKKGGGR